MKKLLFFVAAATLLFASCQKENGLLSEQSKNGKSFTFKANIEQLAENGQNSSQAPVKGTINAINQLVWATGDQIGVYVNDDGWADKNQPFTLSSGAGETSAEFAWDYTGVFSDKAAAAFYPWEGTGSDKNNVYEGNMYFKLRESYWSYESGKMLTPLIASLNGSTDPINFKHAGAAVKVHINNVPKRVHSIGMSVNGQQITGTYSVNPANAGTDALTLVDTPDASKNSVWLNIWNGSQAAWDFIFPVPELSKPKLSFQMWDENDVLVWSKNLKAQSSDLGRGDILVMPDLTITPYSQFTESAEWTLCGNIGGINAWDADIPMYTDGTVTILKGLTFKSGDEFKIRKNKDWAEAYPGSNYAVNEDCTKDVWFNNSTHEITLKDSKCDYPAPKVTLYFGINGAIPKSIHLSSSTLAPGVAWPGLELTDKEYINGKWYYKHVVDGTTVWGKSISGVYIVSKDSWNTSGSTINFNTIKTEYYFEATELTAIEQLSDRPAAVPHTAITIDGDLSEWSAVEGITAGNHTVKVESDNTNLYFYSSRTNASGDYAAIWGGGGYVYVSLDLDNDATTGDGNIFGNIGEFIGLLYPYAGSSASPAFNESPTGSWNASPSPYSIANVVLRGVETSGTATIEFSIPRADLPTLPSDPITVKVWGNKGMSTVSFVHEF